MASQRAHVSFRRAKAALAMAALSALGLGGCAGDSRNSEILVNRPSVFTRERLVSRRVAEVQWLQKHLDQGYYVPTIQGYNDVREFSGFVNKLQGTFDPLKGTLDTAQARKTLADIQRSEQTAEWQQSYNNYQLHRIIGQQQADDQLRQQQFQNAQQQYITSNLYMNLQQQWLRSQGTNIFGTNAAVFVLPSGTNVPNLGMSATWTPTNSISTTVGSPTTNASYLGALDEINGNLSAMGNASNRVKVIDAGDIVQSTARLSSIEATRDEMAYRDFIQASLREKELDDTHDLDGWTIYTLKFDATVIPNGSIDKYARVEFTLGGPSTNQATVSNRSTIKLYRAWHNSVSTQIQREAMDLQRAFRSHQLADADVLRLLRVAMRLEHTIATPTVSLTTPPPIGTNAITTPLLPQAKMEIARNGTHSTCIAQGTSTAFYVSLSHATNQVVDQNTAIALIRLVDCTNSAAISAKQWDADLESVLYLVVEDRYSGLIGPSGTSSTAGCLAFEDKPLRLSAFLGNYVIPSINAPDKGDPSGTAKPGDTNNAQIQDFCNRINDAMVRQDGTATCRLRPYIYSVEPKECAQNISDVAAVEKMNNFVVSLKAAIPQMGASVGDYAESLHASQNRLQAIMRKPLIVGYSSQPEDGGTNGARMGWVLGPRFLIKGGMIGFEHATVQHSCACLAWWLSGAGARSR